jgi:serine/threonine protein kinase
LVTPEEYKRVGEIYYEALELEPAHREAFLDAACADEAGLRREVESLLRAHDKADGYFAAPAMDVAAGLLARQKDQSLIGRSLGHYRVLSLIGSGGMGDVYLAQDTRLGRKVALKMLPTSFTRDRERLRRFDREARAVSALNHPNILTLYEIGVALTEAGETQFIATEFIDGRTLRERLGGGRLDLNDALDLAIQIAAALSAAHEEGVIHRDIKPENVMTRRDGILKVLDFGLAKLTEGQEPPGLPPKEREGLLLSSEVGKVIGTPKYMSPEQARGQKVDPRTDIFSLGVVLYEMVTGRAPFNGVNAVDVIYAILKTEPAPIDQVGVDATAKLRAIIDKALRKRREDRYQTAGELLKDLKDLKEEMAFTAKLGHGSRQGKGEVGAVPTAAAGAAAATGDWSARPTIEAGYTRGKETRRNRRLAAVLLALLLTAAGAGLVWRKFLLPSRTGATGPEPRTVPFTTFPGFESFPSFSPDGEQIAFSWNGEKEDNFDIYVKSLEASAPRRLTTDPAQDEAPAFSPDGSSIAYLRTAPEGRAGSVLLAGREIPGGL